MRKLISTLLSISMITAIPMTTSVFAQDSVSESTTTQSTNTITLAYEDFGDYKTAGITTATDLNKGFGWDGSWYQSGQEKTETALDLSFAEVGGVECITAYSKKVNRDLQNSISLSKAGTYVFETTFMTNNGPWNNCLAGIKLLSSDNEEIMSFGIIGYENDDKSVRRYVPGFSVQGNKNWNIENYVAGANVFYTAKATVTINPNGNDKIDYIITGSNNESVTISSSEIELGTGNISIVQGSFESPTYMKSISIFQKVTGKAELYGETIVAEDDLMATAYGNTDRNSTTNFISNVNLGTGWNGTWHFSSECHTWKYYDGWRGNVFCSNYQISADLSRNFAKAIDFSKDGKYEIRYQDLYNELGSEWYRGFSLASGNTRILSFGGTTVSNQTCLAIKDSTTNAIATSTSEAKASQTIYNNVIEITVNSKGDDTIKYKRYSGDTEPEAWDIVTTKELNGLSVDNVKFSYWQGGVANISIKSNAVTATRIENADGEKVYIDFASASAANTVSMPGNDNAKISYVKDADGKIYSAIVEYNKADTYGIIIPEILAGNTKIPVEVDETAFTTTKIYDTVVEDIINSEKKVESINDYTTLNGGVGLKGNWNGKGWSFGVVGEVYALNSLSTWGNTISRELKKTIDFSKVGEYEVRFGFISQHHQPKETVLKFTDNSGKSVLDIGVKLGIKADGSSITSEDKESVETKTKALISVNGEQELSEKATYTRTGAWSALDNTTYSMVAKICVNGNGKDKIKVKLYKYGTEEPTEWQDTFENLDLSNCVATGLKFYNGNVGTFTGVSIKKDIVTYRKTSEKAYMFFDNDYVLSTNTAFGVSYTDDKTLSDVKYASDAKDFTMTFGNDNEIKVFVWDTNLKSVLAPITITK